MAEIKCPMCGKSNPENLDSCQFCEARLKPVTDELSRAQPPIHVGDEPTRKDTSELEPVLPKWLREVRQQARDSAAEEAEQAEEADAEEEALVEETREDLLAGLQSQPEDDEVIPDWLAGLRGGGGGEALEDKPLRDDQSLAEYQEEEDSESAEIDSAAQLPGWISDLSDASKEAENEESLGDWLASEVRKGKAAEPSGEPPSTSASNLGIAGDSGADQFSQVEPGGEAIQSDGEIPSWLKVDELDASGEEDGAATKPLGELALHEAKAGVEEKGPASASEESDMPGWLGALGEEGGGFIPGSGPDAAGTDTSAESLASQDGERLGTGIDADVSGQPAELPSDAELPDWLAAMDVGNVEPELGVEGFQSPPEDAKVTELSSQPEQPDQPEGVSEPSEVAPFAFDELQPGNEAKDAGAFLDTDASTLSTDDVDAIFSMEMPDWLSEVETSADSRTSPDSGLEPESDDLRPAELPSWVQAMRPVEAFASKGDQENAGQPAEEKGPLAGLRGVLPLVPGVGPSSKPKTYSIKMQASDEQLTSAELLEQMLEGEAYPEPAITQSGLVSQRFLRAIIFVLLLLVVGFSLVTGTKVNQIPLSASTSTARALTIVQEELLPDAAVLVIFDYEAAFAAEMEAVAAPLVDHMILLKHPRLSLLASKPTGAGLSERFMRRTQPGQSFVNLGFLPGDAAGALAFIDDPVNTKPVLVNGQNVWQTATLQGVTSISNFAAILLLTDEAESARVWVEQTENKRGEARLIVISSAQAGPLLLPYVESGQIDGMVTGLDGGGPIEQVNSGRPGKIRQYWDAFGLGLMVAIFIISIGSIWSLFISWQARRTEQGKG